MTSIIKYLLKTFLLFLITITLVAFITDFVFGQTFSANSLLFFCGTWSLLMTMILGTYHVYKVKNNEDLITDDYFSVKQHKTVNSTLLQDELLSRLKSDFLFVRSSFEESENMITIKTKATFHSWGEKISIAYAKISDDLYEYRISSIPKLATTVLDYGKNLKNVKAIERILQTKNL